MDAPGTYAGASANPLLNASSLPLIWSSAIHHGAPSSPIWPPPGSQTEPDIRDWTVACLQRFLKGNSIPFHRNDNKTRLFQLYSASINTLATTTTELPALPASSPGPVTASIVTHNVTGPLSPLQPHQLRQVVLSPVPAPSVSELSHIISVFFTSLCSQTSRSSGAHTSFHPTIPSSTLPSAAYSNTAT